MSNRAVQGFTTVLIGGGVGLSVGYFFKKILGDRYIRQRDERIKKILDEEELTENRNQNQRISSFSTNNDEH